MTTGDLPLGIGVGDVNADGNLDIATGNFFGGNGSLITGNGDGTFNSFVEIPMVPSGATESVGVQDAIIGDFNEDGWGDLAFTVQSGDLGDPGLAILLNDGTGNFPGLPTFIAFSTQPRGLAVADIDQDDNLDIIYSDRDLHTLFIARGNGDGTFTVDDSTLLTNELDLGLYNLTLAAYSDELAQMTERTLELEVSL
ncbi:MAG: VCBS repeat-containing protein, partial [Salinibacterium sp.]|nr:VCBS repeat-containing protein [Salinibacterium sp.]